MAHVAFPGTGLIGSGIASRVDAAIAAGHGHDDLGAIEADLIRQSGR